MSEKFRYKDKIIIMPDATAYRADDDIIACVNYALDYTEHIPMSIFNHSLKVDSFTVKNINGRKALLIKTENGEEWINELRLPKGSQLLSFSWFSEYVISDNNGIIALDFNGEPVLTFTKDEEIFFFEKVCGRYKTGELLKLCITFENNSLVLYINGRKKVEKDGVFTDGVNAVWEKVEAATLITYGAVIKNGARLIEESIFTDGIFTIMDSAKSREEAARAVSVDDTEDINLENALNHMNAFKRPDAKEIIKLIKKRFPENRHNRLYITDFRRDRIINRIKTDTTAKKWYESFLAEAQGYLFEEVPHFLIEDKIRLLPVSRLIKRRLLMFSSLYRINGDRRFLDKCVELMDAASDFPHWNDTHFLDTAELCCGFAIAFDAIYDDLTDEKRQMYTKTIKEKALIPAMLEYRFGLCRTQNRWSYGKGNWNPVCNAGILIGAIAVLYEYEELAVEIIENSLIGIAYVLTEFLPDGGWEEGPGYWHYTVEFIAYYFDALYTSCGDTFGYIDKDSFGRTALYYLAMCGPCGAFNYGDMRPMYVQTPELYWFADVMKDDSLAYVYRRMQKEYNFPENLWSMLHFDPKWEEMENTDVPLDIIFKKWAVGSMRSSWERDGSVYLAFQGGRPNSAHQQMSSGNFVLDIDNVRWAVDLGYDDYNLEYLDSTENADSWWIYRKSAEGHNCFLINPDDKHPQIYNSMSEISAFETTEEKGFCEIDLTPAYRRNAEYAKRSFTLDRTNGCITISDSFKPIKENSEYYWFMHTTAEIKLFGNKALLKEDGKMLTVETDSGVFSIMEAVPLETSRRIPVRDREVKNEGVKKLTLHLERINGESTVTVKMREGE